MSEPAEESAGGFGGGGTPGLPPLLVGSMPSNLVTGSMRGLGTATIGYTCSAAFVIGVPIRATTDGWNFAGIVGAPIGLVFGSVIAGLGGTGIALVSTQLVLYQIIVGLVRTPGSCVAAMRGQDWDDTMQEFRHCDLPSDAAILEMSETEFLAALKAKGSIGEVLAGRNSGSSSTSTNDASAGGGKALKKSVQDKEFYNVLGIEPEASAGEVKKAYYKKAKENHPDRHPDDPEAQKKFQKIGEAYQVLSDEKMRQQYDSKGKDAVEASTKMGASSMYAMIFGNENFEAIIGELQIAGHLEALTNGAAISSELMQFKQRKRELQCAVNLVNKLNSYKGPDSKEHFLEKVQKEAAELTDTALGGALLACIGQSYMDAAKSEMNTLSSLVISLQQTGSGFLNACQTIATGTSTVLSALDLSYAQTEEKSKPNDEKTKENVKKCTARVTENMFSLMWLITKTDIASTLAAICNKVLHDVSVTAEARLLRCEALLMLGQEYYKKGRSEKEGLEDLLSRMGHMPAGSSPFGGAADPSSAEAPESSGSSNDETGSNSSSSSSRNSSGNASSQDARDAVYLSLFAASYSMSVADLKDRIVEHSGPHSLVGCVEKADLKKAFRRICLKKLSVNGLHILAKDHLKLSDLSMLPSYSREQIMIKIMNEVDLKEKDQREKK